jgi:hypothetical protein
MLRACNDKVCSGYVKLDTKATPTLTLVVGELNKSFGQEDPLGSCRMCIQPIHGQTGAKSLRTTTCGLRCDKLVDIAINVLSECLLLIWPLIT